MENNVNIERLFLALFVEQSLFSADSDNEHPPTCSNLILPIVCSLMENQVQIRKRAFSDHLHSRTIQGASPVIMTHGIWTKQPRQTKKVAHGRLSVCMMLFIQQDNGCG